MWYLVASWRWLGCAGRWVIWGGPHLLQDVWVRLLEAVQGAEEATLDPGHVLFCEVGVVLEGGVSAQPQQGHEVGCHHVRAELYGGGPVSGVLFGSGGPTSAGDVG